MKLYDIVWVPDRNGEHEAVHLYTENPEQGRIRREKNMVVMTPDQFKTALLFVIQQGHGMGFASLEQIVDNYLYTKNITIK